jgi:hypothetical protein
MIQGPGFIWLHLPKCAGTSLEAALREIWANNPAYRFDVRDPQNVIWHENVARRRKRDPSFELAGRRIIANFRRLPHWLLSRVHYEAQRPPHHVVTREMLLRGDVFEQSGALNRADQYALNYNMPPVDCWIRTENLVEDAAKAFGLDPAILAAKLQRKNVGALNYINSLDFWFTKQELAGLYAAAPHWAELELRIYGSLLA